MAKGPLTRPRAGHDQAAAQQAFPSLDVWSWLLRPLEAAVWPEVACDYGAGGKWACVRLGARPEGQVP